MLVPRLAPRVSPTAPRPSALKSKRQLLTGLAGLVALPSRPCRSAQKVPDAVEVDVDLGAVQLKVLEASLDWQETLIEQAVEQEDEGAVEADPYGMAVWPAAQVLAHAAVAYGLRARENSKELKVLELGAGCGLASQALLALGFDVIATDFRTLPLELLEESCRRQGLARKLRLQQLDLRGPEPLPRADLVLASDVVYERSTAEAAARRCHEALNGGATVLVADIGRPNRKYFLQVLRDLRPEEDVSFSCSGIALQKNGDVDSSTCVELLELPRGFLQAAELTALLKRPKEHGHVL